MLISDPKAKPQIIVFPKKKGRLAHLRQYFVLYLVLLLGALCSIWLGQNSINAYWQQTYHRVSPLESLNQFRVWRVGADVCEYFAGYYDRMTNQFADKNQQWQSEWQQQEKKLIHSPIHAASGGGNSEMVAGSNETQPEKEIKDSKVIYLQKNDKVLFTGDSIMQGIAPHLQKWLKSEYQIDSINLSKQSTGLAYPSFFDWPATIEQTMGNDANIKLLIILVGANDPWDFPDPDTEKGIPYLKFESERWKKVYLQRVQRIIQAAQKSDAKIIWLGIPYMKRPVLNKQMHYLEHILSTELENQKDTVLWLPINRLVSDGVESYQDFMVLDGKPVVVRTKDGIHFTTRGQQFMADYIASYIGYSAQ